ncbi:DUF2066 domain-containing protein [Celerinatantimonas yamalensis]|uniref:DUF2066 domain-containing protein n=1 Tax=Celerinatantimonas yamalensis TaxID=559956 RepID=A0ABW9G9W7_9GAMM
MRILKNVLLMWVGLLCWHTVFAAQMVDPYQMTVASTGTLQVDQQNAFNHLIERVTGSDQALANPAIAKAASHAGDYLQQYAYQQQDGQKQMAVVFNRKQIEQMLIQAGLPFWADQRPLIIVWDVIEQKGQQAFVADGSDHATQLRTQAQQWALPIILPVMDLDDSMAISPADVWGSFVQPVTSASQRYNADVALMVKSYQDSNSALTNDWQLLDLHQHQIIAQGHDQGSAQGAIDAQMWQQVAAKLAARYAVVRSTTSGGEVQLTFTHINDFSQYHQIRHFLTSQPSVVAVSLLMVNQDSYTFVVKLADAWQPLQAALNLNDNYQPIDNAPYHYQRR